MQDRAGYESASGGRRWHVADCQGTRRGRCHCSADEGGDGRGHASLSAGAVVGIVITVQQISGAIGIAVIGGLYFTVVPDRAAFLPAMLAQSTSSAISPPSCFSRHTPGNMKPYACCSATRA